MQDPTPVAVNVTENAAGTEGGIHLEVAADPGSPIPPETHAQPETPANPKSKKPKKRARAQGPDRPRRLPPPWRGALLALLVCVLVGAFFLYTSVDHAGPAIVGMLIAAVVILCCVGAALALLILWLLRRIPAWALFFLLALAVPLTLLFPPLPYLPMAVALMGLCGLPFLRPGLSARFQRLKRGLRTGGIILCIAVLLTGTAYILWGGNAYTFASNLRPTPTALADPSLPGDHAVETYAYAAQPATDDVWPSRTVDGSAFLTNWKWSPMRKARSAATQDALPLNGRVWMPAGPGPFPLALIVHGNHDAYDPSDGGYAYLGEMLASQGILCVSVDENFLNSSIDDLFTLSFGGSMPSGENDARAFVLLSHIELWDQWNRDANHPAYGKVDMDRIALIGHSRGGEAAALAAAFSQMEYYPDDGAVRFDVPGTIRTVIAIAPVDGQSAPGGKRIAPAGVDYLVVHGSYDMDVSSFMGEDMYHRIDPATGAHKSYVYIEGANHGNFNSGWGLFDRSEAPPAQRVLDTNPILTQSAQQQAAKVLISGFLRASLLDEEPYFGMFDNLNTAAAWLPDTRYIWDCQFPGYASLAGFEEDVELDTATWPGARIDATGFAQWKEMSLPTKYGSSRYNRVLSLEWAEPAEDDAGDVRPAYAIALDAPIPADDRTTFSLRASAMDPDGADLDATLIFTGSSGAEVRTTLAELGGVPNPAVMGLNKPPLQQCSGDSEPILQRLATPPGFLASLGEIARVELRFDKTPSGHILIDELGMDGLATPTHDILEP